MSNSPSEDSSRDYLLIVVLVVSGIAIAITIAVLAFVWARGPMMQPQMPTPTTGTDSEDTAQDTEESPLNERACEALMKWYDQEGSISDTRAGRELREIAGLAEPGHVRNVIEREAHMWESGQESWSNGAQDICLDVLYG